MGRLDLGVRRAIRPGIALFGLLAVPLVVAVVVLAQKRWFPLLDLAQTELRVRDVASGHPPLIGLGGRIGPFGQEGGHPGPLSFWALWPFYQLFGASSWALEAAAAALHLIAMGVALFIAHRRGGLVLLVAMGAVLAILGHGYGASMLTQAWNPFFPVLWWVVFLFAIWSVLCDDLPMLPIAVFAGSFCAQTHISYAALVGGLVVFATGWVVVMARRRWQDADTRQSVRHWGLIAIGVGVLVWLPPAIDQLVHAPGNFSVIWDHFSDPPEAAIGPGAGIELLLRHLNPWDLFVGGFSTEWPEPARSGSILPGLALLIAWGVTAVVAWRQRLGAVVRLHLVLAIAVVLGAISTSRIFGQQWNYLVLWAWGLTALLTLAAAWTLTALALRRSDAAQRSESTRVGIGVLGAIAVLMTAMFTIDAATVELPARRLSAALGDVVPATAAALRDAPGGGEGRYVVTIFPDPLAIGAQAYGLIDELERRGFDVYAPEGFAAGATRYRVLDFERADAVVHIAAGADIERSRAMPAVREVARADVRSRAERAEFERLRSEAIDELRLAGLNRLADQVDKDLYLTSKDARIPATLRRKLSRMLDLGEPIAVFIGPPGSFV